MNCLLREPDVFASDIFTKMYLLSDLNCCVSIVPIRVCDHRALVSDITIAFKPSID